MRRKRRGAWSGVEAMGLCWSLGMTLFTALSFVLYWAGWTGVTATILALAVALGGIAVGTLALWATRRADVLSGNGAMGHAGDRGANATVAVGLGLAATQVALSGWRAARAPFSAWDAWSFWTLKARMFALGGPRPGYFRDALTLHTHPDYPLNLVLAEGALFRVPGQAGVALAALIGPACLAALLLLFYAGLTRLYQSPTAALATGALALIPALPVQAAGGDVDVPLALYTGGAALYLLLWWRLRQPVDAVLMGLLAGGAVWTKKEGLPVAALLVLSYVVGEVWRYGAVRRGYHVAEAWRGYLRRAGSVILAAAILPLPWLLFCRVVHPLGRDFLPFTPDVFLAHADRLPHIIALLLLQMLDFANWSLFWILLAVVLPLAARGLSSHGRGLLLLLLGQVGMYAVSFVFSDWQPYTAHVQTSLDRLLVQALPLALLLLVDAVRVLEVRGAHRGRWRAVDLARDAAA